MCSRRIGQAGRAGDELERRARGVQAGSRAVGQRGTLALRYGCERGRVVPLERIGIEAGGAVDGEDVVRPGVDDDDGAGARAEALVGGTQGAGIERGLDIAARRVFV